jgi:hypothetical protein
MGLGRWLARSATRVLLGLVVAVLPGSTSAEPSGGPDCRSTPGCKENAKCSLDAITGTCEVRSDRDCQSSDLCVNDTLCTYGTGSCVLRFEADCRRSACASAGAHAGSSAGSATSAARQSALPPPTARRKGFAVSIAGGACSSSTLTANDPRRARMTTAASRTRLQS